MNIRNDSESDCSIDPNTGSYYANHSFANIGRPTIAELEAAIDANPDKRINIAPDGAITYEEKERPTIGEVLSVVDGRYILDCSNCSMMALETFNQFLKLVKHGAKTIDIHVRKDGQEHRFQADILKYVRKEANPINT